VRVPREVSQVEETITSVLPDLRPAQRLGLALWVYGAVVAGSACQAAVVAALLPLGASAHALRQRLRDWLYDGADKAAPCKVDLDVATCFAPLLRWVLAWWRGNALPLAIDATALGDAVVVLTVSVLYRGCAIPVAWHVLPANRPGAWVPAILELLTKLGAAVPGDLTVIVQTDRGLWGNRLWDGIRALGWHPLMRLQCGSNWRPRLPPPAGRGAPCGPWCRGPATPGSGPAPPSRTAPRGATARCWWSGTPTRPTPGCC
jgi:hypothetical protein